MEPVILVVEGGGDARQLAGEALTALFPSARILLADSAETALELAQRTPPTVVLLDLCLGGIGSFEFARRLRRLLPAPGVPIVALTAAMLPDTLLRAEAAGFAAFLSKPTDMPRLETVLRPILDRQAARPEITPSRSEESADESDP